MKKILWNICKFALCFTLVACLSLVFAMFIAFCNPARVWFYTSETSLGELQSVFQLGVATSIAFALGRLYFRHALGPKFQSTLIRISNQFSSQNVRMLEKARLEKCLKIYIRHEQDLVLNAQPYFFALYCLTALFDFLLLIFASAISPSTKILSRNALALCFPVTLFCVLGIFDAYLGARKIKRTLHEAWRVFESEQPNEIILFCNIIEKRIADSAERKYGG